MRNIVVTLGMVVAVAPAVARGDAKQDKIESTLKELDAALYYGWKFDKDSGQWTSGQGTSKEKPDPCTDELKMLAELGVPGSTRFELRWSSRDLQKGPHTVDEVRASCAAIVPVYWKGLFEHSAQMAGEHEMEHIAEQCIEAYDQAIKLGISPTARVLEKELRLNSGDRVWFSGTLEEVRVKYCDEIRKRTEAARLKEEAPFRAVLKNDKLEKVLSRSGEFTLIGGDNTRDPKRLAAARVWFDAVEELKGNETCPGGAPRRTLRRYTFDKQHKLVTRTEREFCNDIPLSAFK